MKKVLLLAVALILSFAVLTGCTSDDSDLQDFLDYQNTFLDAMRTDEVSAELTADGDVLIYTYTLYIEGLSEEGIAAIAEPAFAEGQELFDAAKSNLPNISAVVIKFADASGTELASREFSE